VIVLIRATGSRSLRGSSYTAPAATYVELSEPGPSSTMVALSLTAEAQEVPESSGRFGPAEVFARLGRRTPSVVVVFGVERWLPVVWCRSAVTRDVYVYRPRVVQILTLDRFLGQRVGVFGHFGNRVQRRNQSSLLPQFSLRCVHGRLAGLDAAGNDVPISTATWRSMKEKNLAPTPADHKNSDLGPCPQGRSVGVHRRARLRDHP
jgi:hypothetical protein